MKSIYRMMKLFYVIFLLTFLSSCTQNSKTDSAKKSNSMIEGVDAIKLATEFVIEQGYTNEVPLSLKNFKFEKGEFASDTIRILKYRKNTLLKKPLGAKQHGGSWTVGFEYVNQENNIGRAVTLDTLGQNIIMQPNEVRLDWFFEVEKAE